MIHAYYNYCLRIYNTAIFVIFTYQRNIMVIYNNNHIQGINVLAILFTDTTSVQMAIQENDICLGKLNTQNINI